MAEKVKVRDIYYHIGYPIEGRTDLTPEALEEIRVGHPRRFARAVSKAIDAFTGPLKKCTYDPTDFYVMKRPDLDLTVQIFPVPSKLEPWKMPSLNGNSYSSKKQGYYVHLSIPEEKWFSLESKKIKNLMGALGEVLTVNCAEEVKQQDVRVEDGKSEPSAEEIRKFFGLSSAA